MEETIKFGARCFMFKESIWPFLAEELWESDFIEY